MPQDPAIAFIDSFYGGDALAAMLACARRGNVPVHYLTREHFEDRLGRDLTDEEWGDLDNEDYDGYLDEAIRDEDADFIASTLRQAGLDPDADDDEG